MEGTGKFIVTAVGLNSQNGVIFKLLDAVGTEKATKKQAISGTIKLLCYCICI
jgi:hypothetical protein